jgi:hypothetical protein
MEVTTTVTMREVTTAPLHHHHRHRHRQATGSCCRCAALDVSGLLRARLNRSSFALLTDR